MAQSLLSPSELSRVEALDLRARLIVEGYVTGLHRSPYHGFSVEFAEHRGYNPGDDLRHVDWKVFARKDRMFVKQFEEETNLRNLVALDVSRSMHHGGGGVSKLAYGVTLAAALHTLMVRQRDATGLLTFDDQIRTHLPPKSTRSHLRALLQTLHRVLDAPSTADATSLEPTLHAVAERVPRRSLIALISDLFGSEAGEADLVSALHHLRHRGHDVILFHVLHARSERRFDVGDEPLRLRDLETGEERTVQPAQVRDGWREASEAYAGRVLRVCRQLQVDYVPLDTETSYLDALSAFARKRARVV